MAQNTQQYIKFLFWNVHKDNDNTDYIVELAEQENVNIILLAEAKKINSTTLESKLINKVDRNFRSRFHSNDKIMLFDNIQDPEILVNEDRRTCTRLYDFNGIKVLLVAAHLRDKYSCDPGNLYDLAEQTKRYIEETYKKENVIIVGDFNMNPYEKGVMGFNGLNAIMSKERITYQNIRKFGMNSREFYYNPSWEGYNLPYPNGTYYFDSIEEGFNPYWNLLDQVIISSNLLRLDSYISNSFRIITKIGKNHELLRKKRGTNFEIPDCKYSDHLPITFTLKF